MSEDTIKDRIYDPSRETPKTSRRTFLKKMAATAIVAGGGLATVPKTAEAVDNIINPHKPKEVYLGQIEVSLPDLNLRDEPKRHNVYYGDYRLSDIRKINGKEYHNERILSLENATIVEGSDPDTPNDEGIGRWIKIRVQSEGIMGGERDAYISISKKTSGVMKFLDKGGYKPIQELNELPPEQINQTSFKKEFSR